MVTREGRPFIVGRSGQNRRTNSGSKYASVCEQRFGRPKSRSTIYLNLLTAFRSERFFCHPRCMALLWSSIHFLRLSRRFRVGRFAIIPNSVEPSRFGITSILNVNLRDILCTLARLYITQAAQTSPLGFTKNFYLGANSYVTTIPQSFFPF